MRTKEELTERLREYQADNPAGYAYLRDYLEEALDELRKYCGEGSIKSRELASKLDIRQSEATKVLKALDHVELAYHKDVSAESRFYSFRDIEAEELERALDVVNNDEYLTAIA